MSVTPLTVEQFQLVLPDKMKKTVNQELIDAVNETLADAGLYEDYRDNLLSYTKVMADGKYKITDYVKAVRYVSFKLMGHTNDMAYMKAFPDKYMAWLSEGVSSKDIASYVCAYNKGKLVNAIMVQTMVPTHVLNQDLYQQALNVQAELMVSAKSEKVRSDAAAHLMQALKPPEAIKMELEVSTREDSAIQSLRESTLALAKAQREMIANGFQTAQNVAHSKLDVIDVDMKEV